MGIFPGGPGEFAAAFRAGSSSSQCMGGFTTQDPANTTWALATFVQADAKLFAERVRCTKSRQHGMGIFPGGPGECAAVYRAGSSFTASDLKCAGATSLDWRRVGFAASVFKDAGFTAAN